MSEADENQNSTPEDRQSPDDPLIGQTIAGRYRIEALIGAGGMGSVYRAEHVLMKKTVAVKVLHRSMTALGEIVKRFEREALAAGRIDHPNVAVATDFGRLEDGALYLVLEYAGGQTLRELIDADGALPVERALFIARQIAAALGAAHKAGVVHRDLKPDNVMLIERGGLSDFVKVLDFGIAKIVAEPGSETAQLTRMGSIFGTPQYMSPEQAAGKTVDHRVDLYALGLLMHEMLTGRPTFQSPEVIGLLAMQMTEPPPPLPSHVPEKVAEVIGDLLQKEPELRPESAGAVVSRIDKILGSAAAVFDTSAIGLPPAGRTGFTTANLEALSRIADTESPPPAWQTAVRAKADQLSGMLKPLLARIPRDVVVGRRYIPTWAVAAAAVLLLVVAVLAAKAARNDDVSARPAASSDVVPNEPSSEPADDEEPPPPANARLDPELERVIAAARNGQPEALYALSLRKEGERTAREWLAMATGRLKRREVPQALVAYEEAIDGDPRYAADKTMLGALRYLADKEAYANQVLTFAAEHLGSHGADLLFHAWSSTSRVTPTTQLAKELLDRPSVREKASPGLAIALDLRDAGSCEEYKKLLPRAQKNADERSVKRLKMLAETSGCGDDKRSDCYPCLRDSNALLKDTIVQAQLRKAPLYEVPRRWRWR